MYAMNSPHPPSLRSFASPVPDEDVASRSLSPRNFETSLTGSHPPATVTPKSNSTNVFVNIGPLAPPNPLAPLVSPQAEKGRIFDGAASYQHQSHQQQHMHQQMQLHHQQQQRIHQMQPMRATPSPTKIEQVTEMPEQQLQHQTEADNFQQKLEKNQQLAVNEASSPMPEIPVTVLSEPEAVPVRENTGRWSAAEHKLFLQGLEQYGKGWKKIALLIKTRSVVQVRTHAQKYFQKLAKAEQKQQKEKQQDQAQSSENAFRLNKRKESTSGSPTLVRPALPELPFTSRPQKKARQVSVSLRPESLLSNALYVHQQSSTVPFHAVSAPALHAPTTSFGNAGTPHRVSSSSLSEDVPGLDESLLYLLDDGTNFDPDPVPLARFESQHSNSSHQQPENPSSSQEIVSVGDSSPVVGPTPPLSGISNVPQNQLSADGTTEGGDNKGSTEMDALLDLCDPLDWLTDMSMKESFQLPSSDDSSSVFHTEDGGVESSSSTGMQLTSDRVAWVNADTLLDCDDL